MKTPLCIDEGCPQSEPHVCANDIVIVDGYYPNYDGQCENCGQSPTVSATKDGKTVYQGTLCGPCTFGEAACIDPEEWNK